MKFQKSNGIAKLSLGSATAFIVDLSSSVYTYTLVADEQIVETKKMMKL